MPIDLSQMMHPSWAELMQPVADDIERLGNQLVASGQPYLPAGQLVMRAFTTPVTSIRAVVVGQDPYPTPGNAVGLSFSVPRTLVNLPPSLANIRTELAADLGIPMPGHGDLSAWAHQGVMLLNRVLTVAPHAPASHAGLGWQVVTQHAIEQLCVRHALHGQPLVAILWGAQARELQPRFEAAGVPVVASAHPSPMSAHRGFFGSRPFSRANIALASQGAAPIDWRLH